MKVKIVIATVLLSALSAMADKPKAVYKVTRLSVTEVGVSCLNGGDPTGKKIGSTLILSCGE